MALTDAEIASFWFLLRKGAAVLDRGGEALFRDGLGMSLAQFTVLSVVDARPGAFNQQSVADYLGLTKGTVSRQIEAAERAGLLTTAVSPASRREKIVTLTPAGTAIVRQGDELMRAAQHEAFADLDPADFAATVRTLDAFLTALDPAHPQRPGA